ncbi:MAG TPA: PepSY domain-containing protein [Chthoniobacterales bacterium]|nr:PepSY domain-containing protein [Chthoniobacterales bacterium]
MNRSPSSHSRSIARATRKLAIVLFAGIALAVCSFPEAILANDDAQTSKELHARITRSQAEKAALAKVPGGKVKAAKLAQENGQLIWSFDIITPFTKKVAAVQVDAQSGKVLSKLVQAPGDRAEDSASSQKK